MNRQRTEIVQPSGIVKDISAFELPPELWSGGDNVNFRRGRTNSDLGNSNPYPALVVGAKPTYLQWFTDDTQSFWIFCGDTEDPAPANSQIYKTDGLTVTALADGFNNSRAVSWTGCNFNGLMVLNNRADDPQMISDPYNVVVPLVNWDCTLDPETPASPWGQSSRCEVIRPYKNYLIALDNYNAAGTRYSNMVRWSGPAVLGEAPSSWNPEIVGEQAGLYALADTPGRVVDGLTLGDYFVIYKTDSVWLMQFIGGEFTMSFRKLFGGDAGILAKDCIAEFQGKHFVLAPNTAYVHNGNTKEDVMDGWVKDEFFDNVSLDHIDETKVMADHNNNEIWIYYVTSRDVQRATEEGDPIPYATRALVWNWVERKWTSKDLNSISYMAEGYIQPVLPAVDDWDSDSQAWNEDRTRWNGEITFSPVLESLLMASYDNEEFFGLEYTSGSNLYAPPSYVERVGIDFNHDRRFKYLTRIVPHVSGQNPVLITVLMSDIQTTVPTVAAKVWYDPLVDADVDVHCTGRYIGLRFECDQPFTLNGYTLEWEPTGNF
jgi:hypothetical protein